MGIGKQENFQNFMDAKLNFHVEVYLSLERTALNSIVAFFVGSQEVWGLRFRITIFSMGANGMKRPHFDFGVWV